MISAKEISKFHDQYLANPSWPDDFKLQYQASHTIFELIEANHFFNTKLWNEEDLARRKKVSDTEIAKNKRAIDKFNQARNDYIERIDSFIIESINHLSDMRGKQNSETLGSMIDRLSILSLKIFHMSLQTQRNDLGVCYDELMMDCHNGSRYFKQYKQFKMYNDPNLNPKIYSEK